MKDYYYRTASEKKYRYSQNSTRMYWLSLRAWSKLLVFNTRTPSSSAISSAKATTKRANNGTIWSFMLTCGKRATCVQDCYKVNGKPAFNVAKGKRPSTHARWTEPVSLVLKFDWATNRLIIKVPFTKK